VAEYKDRGRTVAFRIPNDVWAKVGALIQERNARASVVLRELVTAGLAAQGSIQERTSAQDAGGAR